MSYPILKILNINKKLSDYFSLKNISIELYKGEVHAIIGENGSGKSSLMNIIWGNLSMDSGEIYIDNMPVSINSPATAKSLGITMIHQDSSLFEHFTIAENIFRDNLSYNNKFLKIINWKKVHTDCQELLEKLGLPLNSRNIVKNLNIAQKQLVEICKAYVSNARIIIMDEPTSALTESEFQMFFNIIQELKKSGATILFISHKLEEIKQIADRITVIRNGEIIGTQNTKNMNVNSIIHMMTGMNLSERYPKLNVKIGKEVLKVNDLCAGDTIKDVNFSLRKKEILGIIGLIGSGRSKIARCIFGLDKIDAGELIIDNKKTDITSPADATAAGIGYVTEDRSSEGLFMYMNIPENISAPNMSKVTNKLLIHKDIERNISSVYAKKLGIKHQSLSDKPAYLSGGNQQKLVLAKWIMSKSKILILDEPTKGIDIASKVDLYNIMNELVIKDASIILISSDVEEVIGMCDRIIVLYAGKVAAILPRSEATREKIIFFATGEKF
jgi:ABC-type sugar transport system ATPase subunit